MIAVVQPFMFHRNRTSISWFYFAFRNFAVEKFILCVAWIVNRLADRPWMPHVLSIQFSVNSLFIALIRHTLTLHIWLEVNALAIFQFHNIHTERPILIDFLNGGQIKTKINKCCILKECNEHLASIYFSFRHLHAADVSQNLWSRAPTTPK